MNTTAADGTTTENEYDLLGRLIRITTSGGGVEPNVEERTYDAANRIVIVLDRFLSV